LVFAVLIFRRDDAATHGAMQMFAALPCVTAGLGVTAGAHHRYPDRGQSIAKRRTLARAEDDAEMRERHAQCAGQLHKFAVVHGEERTKSASGRTHPRNADSDLRLPTVFE
jgi:hypothetical protein